VGASQVAHGNAHDMSAQRTGVQLRTPEDRSIRYLSDGLRCR